jgi:hypothetical protein
MNKKEEMILEIATQTLKNGDPIIVATSEKNCISAHFKSDVECILFVVNSIMNIISNAEQTTCFDFDEIFSALNKAVEWQKNKQRTDNNEHL